MLSDQEKLLEFNKSIERELMGQITQIDNEIEHFKQAQTAQIEDEVYNDCYRMIQKQIAKIKLDFTTERSRKLSELKKGMLLKRDEYVSLVFNEVRQKLIEFVESDQYLDFISRKLQEAIQSSAFEKPHLFVREADLLLAGEIQKKLPNCVVKASPDITIGGFVLEDENKPYIINESLDNTLEEQKEWFYSHSGLRIPQL